MLKLEKAARKRDINITVRYKEKKLNPPFLLALGAALSLHLVGALIFHIAPFKIGYQESVIPPVAVAIDISGIESQWETMAAIEDEKIIPSYLLLPIVFEPPLPSDPETLLMRDLGSITPEISRPSPFITIESDIIEMSNPLLEYSPTLNDTFLVTVAGPLASKKLLSVTPIYFSEDPPLHTFSFEVRVDDSTGEICWFQQKSETSSDETFKAAVKYLKSLRFEEDKNHFMSVGEIAFSIPEHKRLE